MKLKRIAAGYYETPDRAYSIQCPNTMDGNDPDRHWYVLLGEDNAFVIVGDANTFGPFDTKKEATSFVAHKLLLKPIDQVTTKDEAEDIAKEWQHSFAETAHDWGTLADASEYFESLAIKFPELREVFKENAII